MGRRILDLTEADPKGLVRESYRIDGITAGECRSIFMDWALSVPIGIDTPEALRSLLAHYGSDNADHPMTVVLTDALLSPSEPARRRGGRIGRRGAGGPQGLCASRPAQRGRSSLVKSGYCRH